MSASRFSRAPSPPPDLNQMCIYISRWRQSEEEGPSSGGVRAGGGWWWVEMVGVTSLSVWRRRAAFIVLLCWQVLASGCGWWGHRFWVIVQVTGVALGCCHWGHSPARSIVTVTDISAAGCSGWCKVPVAIRPVAVGPMCRGTVGRITKFHGVMRSLCGRRWWRVQNCREISAFGAWRTAWRCPCDVCAIVGGSTAAPHDTKGTEHWFASRHSWKRTRQRAWVWNITEGHRSWAVNHIVVSHGLPISLHTRTQHPLADKVYGSRHKNGDNNSNNWTNCVGGLWCWLLSWITVQFIRFVTAVHIVVTFLVFSDTLTIGTAELIN